MKKKVIIRPNIKKIPITGCELTHAMCQPTPCDRNFFYVWSHDNFLPASLLVSWSRFLISPSPPSTLIWFHHWEHFPFIIILQNHVQFDNYYFFWCRSVNKQHLVNKQMIVNKCLGKCNQNLENVPNRIHNIFIFFESHIVRIFSRAQVHSIISYNGLNNLFVLFWLVCWVGK